MRDSEEVIGVPDLLGDGAVELAALDDVGCREIVVRLERKATGLDEREKPGVLFLGLRVEAGGEEVLTEVAGPFLGVCLVVVAGVELLGQQE